MAHEYEIDHFLDHEYEHAEKRWYRLPYDNLHFLAVKFIQDFDRGLLAIIVIFERSG